MSEIIRIGALDVRFLQSKEDTDGSLDMFEMACPPEARMPVPHYHRDWDETVFGLSGTVTFTVAGRPVDLGPGDTIFIKRGTIHAFQNRGSDLARCLCVLTPGVLGPAYFRETGAALASGRPDPDTMRAIMTRHGLVPVEDPA